AGSQHLTSTREENLFSSRFFLPTVIPSGVEAATQRTTPAKVRLSIPQQNFNAAPRDLSTSLRSAYDDNCVFPPWTLCSLCELISSDAALPQCSGECRPGCRQIIARKFSPAAARERRRGARHQTGDRCSGAGVD